MALLRQVWTLTRKNILINLNRHAFSTIIRAFILPIAFVIFLSYARNLFIPPSVYGIGPSTPIRTLQEGMDAATGGRNTVAFLNNGMAGGNIDQVIDIVAASTKGTNVKKLSSRAELLEVCRSSLRGASTCYGAVEFHSSPTEGIGGWNYTLHADGSFGTKIDVNKDDNEVEVYILPLQRAVDYAIAGIDPTVNQSGLPNTVQVSMYTSLTQTDRNTLIRVNYQVRTSLK
jgi:ATP-binding cassette subfamily A (ABC1) protein 3